MKIKLTDEQRQKMTSVFATLNELRNDKKFIQLMEHVCSRDFNEPKAVKDGTINDENEDDYMRLVNFHDDLVDYANNYFNYFE